MNKQLIGDKILLFSGLSLLAFLSIPPIVVWMETSMVMHMLVQIPGLILGGYLVGLFLKNRMPYFLFDMNKDGYAGMIMVIFVATFWLLPRSLDSALSLTVMEITKFVSLPLLVGIPLALSWSFLHPIAKSFLWANLISMLGVMSWLYLKAPIRLCNNYLVNQQIIVGQVMLMLTFFIFFMGIVTVFFGNSDSDTTNDM